MTMVQKREFKWTDIVKELQGSRSDHMVKNRYNSLINKWKKKNYKLSNQQIEKKVLDIVRTVFRKKNKSVPIIGDYHLE